MSSVYDILLIVRKHVACHPLTKWILFFTNFTLTFDLISGTLEVIIANDVISLYVCHKPTTKRGIPAPSGHIFSQTLTLTFDLITGTLKVILVNNDVISLYICHKPTTKRGIPTPSGHIYHAPRIGIFHKWYFLP